MMWEKKAMPQAKQKKFIIPVNIKSVNWAKRVPTSFFSRFIHEEKKSLLKVIVIKKDAPNSHY